MGLQSPYPEGPASSVPGWEEKEEEEQILQSPFPKGPATTVTETGQYIAPENISEIVAGKAAQRIAALQQGAHPIENVTFGETAAGRKLQAGPEGPPAPEVPPYLEGYEEGRFGAMIPPESQLPPGAVAFDMYGRPYFGGGIQGWAKETAWKMSEPVSAESLSTEDIDKVFGRGVPFRERIGHLPGAIAEIFGGTERVLGAGEEGAEPNIVNKGLRLLNQLTKGALSVFPESARATKQTFSVLRGLDEMGKGSPLAEQPFGWDYKGAWDRQIDKYVREDYRESYKFLENLATPLQVGWNLLRALTAPIPMKEQVSTLEKNWDAGKVFFTSVWQPVTYQEYTRRWKSGEDANLLAMELENPIAEAIGEFIFDPLNVFGLVWGRDASFGRMVSNSTDNYLSIPKEMEPILDDLVKATSPEAAQEAIVRLARAQRNNANVIRAGQDAVAAKHTLFSYTPTANRYIVGQRTGELYQWIIANSGKVPGNVDHLEALDMLEGLVHIVSEDLDEVALGLDMIKDFKAPRPLLSRAGNELGIVLRRIMTGGTEGVVDHAAFLDTFAEVSDDMVKLADNITMSMDKALEGMFPTIAEKIAAGIDVTRTQRSLAKFDAAAQKYFYKPANSFFSALYLGLSPGYAIRNYLTNNLHILVDEGPLAFRHRVSTWLRRSNEWLGGKVFNDEEWARVMGAIKRGEDVSTVLPKSIGGFGKGTFGVDIYSAARWPTIKWAENMESAASILVTGRTVEREMLRMLRPGRALPDIKPLMDLGVPESAAKYLWNLVVDHKGDVNRSLTKWVKSLDAGTLEVFRSPKTYLNEKEIKILSDYNVLDDLIDAVQRNSWDEAEEILRRVKEDFINDAKQTVEEGAFVSKDSEGLHDAVEFQTAAEDGAVSYNVAKTVINHRDANSVSLRANEDVVRNILDSVLTYGTDEEKAIVKALKKTPIDKGGLLEYVDGSRNAQTALKYEEFKQRYWDVVNPLEARVGDLRAAGQEIPADELIKAWNELGVSGKAPTRWPEWRRKFFETYAYPKQNAYWDNLRKEWSQVADYLIEKFPDYADEIAPMINDARYATVRAGMYEGLTPDEVTRWTVQDYLNKGRPDQALIVVANDLKIPTTDLAGKIPLENTDKSILGIVNKELGTNYKNIKEIPFIEGRRALHQFKARGLTFDEYIPKIVEPVVEADVKIAFTDKIRKINNKLQIKGLNALENEDIAFISKLQTDFAEKYPDQVRRLNEAWDNVLRQSKESGLSALAEGEPLDARLLTEEWQDAVNEFNDAMNDIARWVADETSEDIGNTVRVGITNILGRGETDEIDVLLHGYEDQPGLLGLLDEYIAENDIFGMNAIDKLVKMVTDSGAEFIDEVFPGLITHQSAYGRWEKQFEPTIEAIARNIADEDVSDLLYKMAKVGDTKFGQNATIAYDDLVKVDDFADVIPGEVITDVNGLQGKLEPALNIEFERPLTLEEITQLDDFADNANIFGFSISSDKTRIELVNLSLYNTEYDEFIDKLGQFAQEIEDVFGVGSVRTLGVRRTWHVTHDPGAGEIGAFARTGGFNEATGTYRYEDYYKYFETGQPERAARARAALGEIPPDTPQLNKYLTLDEVRAQTQAEYNWIGKKDYIRFTIKDRTAELLPGRIAQPEDLPDVLYHVTPATTPIKEDGVLRARAGMEFGGLGGGAGGDAVWFTKSIDDAENIERELKRAIQIANGDLTIDDFDMIARTDEIVAGLEKGDLDKAYQEAQWWYGENIKSDTYVGKEIDLTHEAFNQYLHHRSTYGGLENPILFGSPSSWRGMSPDDVTILRIPRENLFESGALVRHKVSSSDFLHEVAVHGDVPLRKIPPPAAEGVPQYQPLLRILDKLEEPTDALPNFVGGFLPNSKTIDGNPSGARVMAENLDGFTKFWDDITAKVKENWGKSVQVGKKPAWWTAEVKKAVKDWAKGAEKGVAEARILAAGAADEARKFTLLSYPEKRYFDLALSYIYPYHFWYNRTYANWLRRIAYNPEVIAAYAKYKEAMAKIHAGAPEWWRYNINVGEALGMDPDNPIFFNLEQTLNPLYGLTGVDFNDPERRTNWFTGMVDDLNKFGPSIWTPYSMAIALALKMQGEEAGAARWGSRLIPQTAALKSATALLNVGPKGGLEIDPAVWFFSGGIGPYERRRVGRALYELADRGLYSPEEVIEAARTQSGQAWKDAYQFASELRGPGQLASAFAGVGFKMRSASDMEIDNFYEDYFRLWTMEPNLSPEEFRRSMDWLREQYPFMDTVLLSRKGGVARDRSYAYNVLLRIPPGQRDDIAEMVGLDYEYIEKFYEEKGDIGTWAETDRRRFMAAIVDIGAILSLPEPAVQQEWTEAKILYQDMRERGMEIFGDDIWDRVDRYYAAKGDTKEAREASMAIIEADPAIGWALDWKTGNVGSHPLMNAYYQSTAAIEQYWKGAMYTAIEQELGEDIWDKWDEYWNLKDTDGDYKQYYKDHPELKKYGKLKEKYEKIIAGAISRAIEKIPEGKEMPLQQVQPKSYGEEQLVEGLTTEPEPTPYTFSWQDWQGYLSDAQQNLILDYVLGDLEIPESSVSGLEKVADEAGVSYDTMLELMRISLQEEPQPAFIR